MADITLIIPNRTHAFPINIKGIVTSNDNSGTDIFVFVGSEKAMPVDDISGPLQYKISVNETNMFAGEITKDENNKKFIMSNIDGSSIGIDNDLVVVSDINSENAADFKNIPSTKGQLEFVATISDADGNIHTKTQVCDYVKSRSLFSTETNFLEVGTTLRASNESIMDPEGIKQVVSFNWYRGENAIEGATESSYVITNDDVNYEISAVLKYIDGKDNQKEVIAIQNVFVVNSAPINFPIITGIPESGRALTADTSFIYDRNGIADGFIYEWTVNDVAAGITTDEFQIAEGDTDAGKILRVSVTYTDGAGAENTLVSPPVTIRDSAAGDTVTVSGLPKIGQNIQASIQTSDGTVPTILEYEWRRGGRVIEGANSDTYRIKRADINSFLTVTIKYDAGAGVNKYKTSGVISFENSAGSGLPILNKILEDGSHTSNLGTGASVGTSLYADVSEITDPDDIKDFYYSFDDLTDGDLLRDKVALESKISHNVVSTRRSSTNQNFIGISDEISYDESLEVQSVYLDNSLGNSGDIIYIQYKDENEDWQDALEVTGKESKYFLLDSNISSSKWRLAFNHNSLDETASSYTFEAKWALESPSILSTRRFIYQWQRTVDGIKQDILGARKQTYLLSQDDLNSTVNVKVVFQDGANNISSLESNSISIQNYGPIGKVTMEGVAKTGNVLTAKHNLRDRDNITAENTDGTVTQIDSYQWLLEGLPIEGATSQTLILTSDMETKRVSVSVTYTDALNAEHTVTSNRRKVNSSPTGGVSIVGTPKVNKQLTINTSNLKDLNQFNQLFYQWFSVDNGVETEIANASLQQFTVRLTDIGKSLRANVYYTDNDGFQETVSTDVVAILDSVATGVPSIDGVVLAGNTVTANIANINDDNGIQGYQYQWRVDSQNIEGATFNSFTISPDENGNYGDLLDLVVTVTDLADNTYVLYSEPVRIALAAGTVGEDGGTVSGENVSLTIQAGSLSEDTVIYVYETQTDDDAELPEGSTLVGTAWAFTPHGTTFSEPVSIQFEVPEGTNLVLRADNEEDNTFEIVESYNVESTTATIQTNTFSVYVGSVFTPAVITGTPEQGNYLTASVSGDVGDITFQWLRDGVNILNAQNSTYLVKLEDVGKNLSVAATFTDANNVSTTKISSDLEILNTPAQGQVKVNGSRRVGVTLESQIISITDVNEASESYSYQWFRNDLEITDATSANYEVVEDDFMKKLFVRVSFTDAAQNIESVDSEEVFITKEGSIYFNSASRRQGDTLTINVSTLNDFYRITNTNYTWYLDNEAVANGSTMKERQLTTQDSGKNLKAVLTYTDGRGTIETLETDERFIYTIAGTITPAGGTIADNGISINIPAGAVSENIDILVYVVPYVEGQLPIGTLSDELAYAFTPLDLAFDQPITITLPKPNDEYDMVLYGANNSVDEFLMTEDDFLTIDNTNQITVQTDNFGVFASAILYVRVDILGTPEQGQVLDTLFTGEVHSYTYQWYRGDTPIAGETGSTYTVVLEDVGEEIKIIATYLLEEDSVPETVESEPVLIVNSQPEVDTSAIVSGEDRVGEILTADPSGITDDNNPDGLSGFLYQWKVEGQDIDGATSETLTIQPEHFNKNITVEITYVDATGLLESVTSDNLYITRIPPTGYVEVIGTPEVGEYLEVDTDNLVDLNGIGEFSYQWHADGVDLAGETNASLLVTSDMEDKAISATLTYTDGVTEVETVTTRNAPVIDADPVGNVVIDYTILEVAQTLVANTNAISDVNSPGGITGYTYQWSSNGSPISGATSKNYVVANQFCNTNITVTVTYTDGDGYIETLTSDAVTIVNSPVQGQPTVSGTPGVSETLTINTDGLISDVNVIGALNYKWFADGEEIAGATEKTWIVAANSYVGKEITGQVYYVDGAGNNEEVNTSNGLTIQNSLPVGKPVVDGTFQVGQTLTVYTNEIEDFNVIATPFSFQWYADNVAIANETGSNYVIQVSDINKYISVDASYTDEGNTLETVRSLEHLVVNTPGTATVLITNTGLEQGDILSSSVTSQDDNVRVSDYSYQWKRNGANVLGANEPTYVLGHNDWDKDITLQVSFTDTGGFVETFQSENSVSMINSLPTGDIIITGSNKVGEAAEIDVSQIQDKNYIPELEFLGSANRYARYDVNSQNYQHTRDINFDGVKELFKITVSRVNGYFGDFLIKDENGDYHNIETLGQIDFDTYNFSGTFYLNTPIRATGVRFGAYNQPGGIYWFHNITVSCYGIPTQDTQVFNYQWYRDGQMLPGSTEKTYTTTFDDLYKTLTVDVSYTDFHGNVEIPNNTASFDIVNSPPEGTVLIAGTRNVGEELYFTHNVVDRDNVTVDNPTGLVTFSSYQWYQSDFEDGELTLINDATGSTLLLTPELQAKWIALDATYVDIEGDDDTIHASNRLPVKSTPTGNAIITSADLQLGRQVFIDTSTIADQNDLGEFSYQWYRTEGTGSIAISGAVQTHYSFQPDDLGENIYCVVSYVDGDGDQEHVTSNNLGPVVQTNGSVGTVSVTDRVEIGGTIESDLENIFVMNNFETVAPVVAYNFHSDTRDVGSNQLHLAGTNYSFDEEGGLDLSHSTSAYLRTSGTTPVLNNDTHTIAFRVMLKGGTSSLWRKILSFGRTNHSDASPEIWWDRYNKKLMLDYSAGGTTTFYTTDLQSDVWYDIMFIKQGSAGRVYVDGTLVNEYTGAPNPKPTGDYLLEFGWASSTHPAAPVIIKDFQIFDFAVDDYTSVTNYPFYTEPTLSLQWKADGNPIAGATGSVYQVPENNTELGKDITLEVSLTDALGNARTVESSVSTVVGSDLVQVERFLLEDGSEMLQEDGSSFLSETTTENISLPLSINGDSSQTILSVDDIISVDVSNVVDPNGLAGVEYQWYANNAFILDATGSSYTITADETNKDIRVKAVFEDGMGRKSARLSDEITVVNTAITGTIQVSSTGEYKVGNALLANSIDIADDNGIMSVSPTYQWYRDGSAISGEIGRSYIIKNADVGAQLHVVASIVDNYFNIETITSDTVSIVDSTGIGSATINGLPKVGATLAIDTSGLSDPNEITSFSYQWRRGVNDLSGETNQTYTVIPSDYGQDITAVVTYVDGAGNITTLSNLPAIHIVRAAALGSVTITGTAEVLSTLTATDTITDQDLMGPKNYQWYLNGSAISGATSSTFEIPRGYEGQDIHVVLSYVETLEDGSNDVETMVSNIVQVNSKPYGTVTVTGPAKKGQTLSIDMSEVIDTNIIDNTTKTYQWQREVSNGVFQNISGATSSTYVPVNDDVENKIRVVVSYTDEAGFNESINSVPVLVENSLPTGVISFSGTRKTGNTIAATISNISDPNGIATIPEYQWKLDGEILVGETGNSYTIIADDVGKELSLQLTYTDSVGIVEVEEQSAGIIEDSETTGQVDITGDFVLNGTVTADISSIADTDGIDTISYQWKALDVEIPGATSQTYVLNDSDMRRFNISVEVSVLDVNGTIKTFSKKKWFDEGAMVATYKWYHFDDLNHILNFQADDQLVTNNLQLHLDANSQNNINGAVWNDLTSNAHNVSIKNDYSSTTGNVEQYTYRMSNGDISSNSYQDINRTIDIPDGSVVSGTITVDLDVFEDYYRHYRSRTCTSYGYYYCCGYYCRRFWWQSPNSVYCCGNHCYGCLNYSYGSWEDTDQQGREYSTSNQDFYLISPSGKEYLIKSGDFSRNSTFEIDADGAEASGTWKIRIKAERGTWDWEYYYTYSNSQGYYYYRRYIDTSISFEYETIDGTSATYSEQGVLGGFDPQQGSFEGLITVEDNKSLKPLEQITLEAFVYRENWSQSPNYGEYLAHKDKYELYLDQSNVLTFRVNDSRVNTVNLDRFGLNGWNHIVATYDGVSFKFFINGNLIDATNSINTRQGIDFGDSDDLYIASKGDLFSRWSGKISSFKLYDRAITRKEVLSNYNYELARNGLTEKTFSLQSQENYLVTNGKVGSYNTSVSTEHTKELRGYFKPLQSGDHTFYVYGADKGYFWVGDKAKERISTSNADIETTSSGEFSYTIYLEADTAYPIRFISGNSYEDSVTSTSRLDVQGPGLSKTTNLQSYLFGGDAAWTYWDTAVAKVTYMVEDFDSQWDDISAYDFTGFSDYQTIISNFGLNVNRTLSEPYRWDTLPEVEFSDGIETSLEESFEDTSWTGPNRFDWTGVEDPKQVASTFGINGYTSFGDNEERFKWTDAPTATFSGDSLVEESFEDDSWTGFTRVDWTGVDPADYRSGIQGYWEGTHDWTSEPQPQFQQDTFVFSEEFEDTSWTGYTRFDWTGTENPSSVVSGKGFAAHWEGQFKWSERAQTSFSEKSLLLEESFEEDWTI